MRCLATLLLGVLAATPVAAQTGPWIRLDLTGGRDTQVLERAGGNAEAGLYLTPALALAARTSMTRFAWSDSTAHVSAGDLGLSGALAGPLSFELRAGAAHWSGPGETRLTGRAATSLRLARNGTAELSAERSPYLYTTAALATVVLPTRYQLRLALDAPSGWAGEAGVRADVFGDDNSVRSAWAWLLAPLVRRRTAELRAGWHVGRQDAEQSRQIAVPAGFAPDGTRLFIGRFVPYHTPERTISHGPAVAATLWPQGRATLFANGSWGLNAAEDAGYFFPADTLPDSPPARGEYRRTFHPLDVRATLRLMAGPRTSFFLEASHMRTAFYDDTRGRAGMLVLFSAGR